MSTNIKKYIFVSGGNISGLGKGITASSLGLILKAYGWKVTVLKIDPYLNIDAGTMSPFEHGETFVTRDGKETDLDLGNYERFLDINLSGDHNLTTGRAYLDVITKERRGEYLGKTVQVVHHITDYIIDHIKKVARTPLEDKNGDTFEPEICIIELGGTVGDIESSPFLEAISQFIRDLDKNDYCSVHVTLVPRIGKEDKTKLTQHSMKTIRSAGIFPDILCLRCEEDLTKDILDKMSKLCHIPPTHIISNKNVPNIYYVPDIFLNQNVPQLLHEILKLPLRCVKPNFDCYMGILDHFHNVKKEITIGIVGKYVENISDTYLSLYRAIEHASFKVGRLLRVKWIASGEQSIEELDQLDGIVIPGGFGQRGIEDMIWTVNYAHDKNIPLLGICLGMQIMVIERARTVMGWTDANSREFDKDTNYPVIKLSNETEMMGGTMRLGESLTTIENGSIAYTAYGTNTIKERHRHRYEANLEFVDKMVDAGCINISGWDPSKRYVEIIEDPKKSFWVGVQFHPEFNTRHTTAHPLFVKFLEKCADSQ